MHLTLVVADFFPQQQALAAAAEELPALPALATILRYGRRAESDGSWRAWLARDVGRPDLAALAPAQVAAAALGSEAPREQPWLAAPVHLLAGIDHLRLHPAGLLQLEAAQSARLAADFAAAFGDTARRLAPLCGGFLLTGVPLAPASAVTDRDPARWLGANIASAQAGVAPALRAITAELEMWLHEHAVNQQRLKTGQLPVNALWLWGGDPPSPESPDTGSAPSQAIEALRVYGGDGYVAGLCARCALPLPGVAQTFAQVANERVLSGVVVVVSAAGTHVRDAPLLRIERDWLLPALAAVRDGSVAQLRVRLGATLVTLNRSTLRRFWRRERPWWQALSRE